MMDADFNEKFLKSFGTSELSYLAMVFAFKHFKSFKEFCEIQYSLGLFDISMEQKLVANDSGRTLRIVKSFDELKSCQLQDLKIFFNHKNPDMLEINRYCNRAGLDFFSVCKLFGKEVSK